MFLQNFLGYRRNKFDVKGFLRYFSFCFTDLHPIPGLRLRVFPSRGTGYAI